jgi:hypothetical protein
MEVDPAHEDEFNHWYNDEHLPERLEIPGYVSARRFKLEEGEGVLRYLCIWELEDGSPLQSEAYKAQQRRPTYRLSPRAPAGQGPLKGHTTMSDLPRRTIGRTGLQVTTLGFGALELRGMVAGVGRPPPGYCLCSRVCK